MQLHNDDYETINRRTLDSHKWFHNEFNKAEVKLDKINKANEAIQLDTKFNYLILLMIIFTCLPKLNIYGKMTVILVTLVLIYLYDRTALEDWFNNKPSTRPVVYMRFFCPDIFYRNRHYIFSGNKTALAKAFQLERDAIDSDKSEPYFGRGDHDDLLDMPLDTFCNELCECLNRTEPSANYNCSHWRLHSFNSHDELQEDIRKLEVLNQSPTYMGFKHEIIYI